MLHSYNINFVVIATGKDTAIIANERANFKLLSEKVGIWMFIKIDFISLLSLDAVARGRATHSDE